MCEKFEPKNGYVRNLRKGLEEMTASERETFLLRALDSAFGNLKSSCWKVKQMQNDISKIREEIIDD